MLFIIRCMRLRPGLVVALGSTHLFSIEFHFLHNTDGVEKLPIDAKIVSRSKQGSKQGVNVRFSAALW